MNEKQSHIPTEVYLDFLGRNIDIHWDYHAIFMFSIWFVLVPLCILIIRYGKPKPMRYGLRRKVAIKHIEWWWFASHKYGLSLAVGLSLVGLTAAVVVSQGISGSIHSTFGLLTIGLGCLQVIGGLFRGSHGGRYYYTADPDDPSTWRGDHYDMTTRRQIFEAYHKTAGYFTSFFAIGAVTTGMMQFPMPVLTVLLIVIGIAVLIACVVLEYMGRRYDGYRAAHGYGQEQPFNKAREHL